MLAKQLGKSLSSACTAKYADWKFRYLLQQMHVTLKGVGNQKLLLGPSTGRFLTEIKTVTRAQDFDGTDINRIRLIGPTAIKQCWWSIRVNLGFFLESLRKHFTVISVAQLDKEKPQKEF